MHVKQRELQAILKQYKYPFLLKDRFKDMIEC